MSDSSLAGSSQSAGSHVGTATRRPSVSRLQVAVEREAVQGAAARRASCPVTLAVRPLVPARDARGEHPMGPDKPGDPLFFDRR
jgi:hypothetical protein